VLPGSKVLKVHLALKVVKVLVAVQALKVKEVIPVM
jgi:hypothetical protein